MHSAGRGLVRSGTDGGTVLRGFDCSLRVLVRSSEVKLQFLTKVPVGARVLVPELSLDNPLEKIYAAFPDVLILFGSVFTITKRMCIY